MKTMMKNNYTIDYDNYEYDGVHTVKINEEVLEGDAPIGDIIGIDKNDNCLWFSESADPDDRETKDFIKKNFQVHQAVLGYIRRINS